MRKSISLLLMGVITVFLGCSSSEKLNNGGSGGLSKFDAPLRQQIRSVGSKEILYILGKCKQPITLEMRDELAARGIIVYSTIGDAFSASGPVRSIEEIAELPYVMQLQLSAKAYPR